MTTFLGLVGGGGPAPREGGTPPKLIDNRRTGGAPSRPGISPRPIQIPGARAGQPGPSARLVSGCPVIPRRFGESPVRLPLPERPGIEEAVSPRPSKVPAKPAPTSRTAVRRSSSPTSWKKFVAAYRKTAEKLRDGDRKCRVPARELSTPAAGRGGLRLAMPAGHWPLLLMDERPSRGELIGARESQSVHASIQIGLRERRREA